MPPAASPPSSPHFPLGTILGVAWVRLLAGFKGCAGASLALIATQLLVWGGLSGVAQVFGAGMPGRVAALAAAAGAGAAAGPCWAALYLLAQDAALQRPWSVTELGSLRPLLKSAAQLGAVLYGALWIASYVGTFAVWFAGVAAGLLWLHVAEGAAPREALDRALRMVRGAPHAWLLLLAVLLLAHFAAVLPCGMGLPIVLPWSALAIVLTAEWQRGPADGPIDVSATEAA